MKQNVISFHYTVKTKSGAVLESSSGGDPMIYLEGSARIIPGLARALQGSAQGQKKSVALSPVEAYGEYDDGLVVEMDRNSFPKEETIEVGDQFRIRGDGDELRVYTVAKISTESVTMDGNHPLAGQELFFDLEVMNVRPATAQDVADDKAAEVDEEEECCEDHSHHGHTH